MPSGVSDDVAEAVLDAVLGVGADTGIVGVATLYLDLLTTAPSDDNGTGAVSWGEGRTAVPVVDATQWPAAAARAKTGAAITMDPNASGTTIDAVAFGWYTAATGGTYKGGGPLPGDLLSIPDGDTPVITPTLSSPPPS